ncbi:hypothetical protein [Sulfurimonas autotrophica]|uniref:DUF2846 domain-containing protein n=1 Tax=Sulfurimonas autotrophica (strain ATCC BAA-671 / DSM 16294 / JCM 11897 / OK10) TaxID=563040 RepID=E0UR11_SULAO|nr:hypothetical protein [Sulfurimonas autotrophica]ADN09967.1 hypothetical protein Saut_1924 [Sulfurimonas autotrophica DSM 16294]
MKKVMLFLLSLSSMFFVSCSNMEVGFEEESIFYRGAVVYIYLDKNADKNAQYKVYINGEDSEVSLIPDTKTRFGIKAGKTNISITKGSQKASIVLMLEGAKSYYLNISQNNNGKLQIKEVQKESISKDVKSTSLYVDENENKMKEVPSVTVSEETDTKKAAKKKTVQKTDKDESETTFYYDPNDGE